MVEKRLGRGLDYLLNIDAKDSIAAETPNQQVLSLPVSKIRKNRFQPRENIDDSSISELKASIKENGVLQPILVKKQGKEFELIAGERRLRASISSGFETIPSIILDIPTEKLLQLAIIENIQRENLNPMEEARAYKAMLGLENITHDELSKRVGKQRSTITNVLRLLELPEKVQNHVSRGTISSGHARALLSIKSKDHIIKVCNLIIRSDLSVREVERIVKNSDAQKTEKQINKKTKKSTNISAHEETLKDHFETKVDIQTNGETGSIRFHFFSKEDFLRLYNILLN